MAVRHHVSRTPCRHHLNAHANLTRIGTPRTSEGMRDERKKQRKRRNQTNIFKSTRRRKPRRFTDLKTIAIATATATAMAAAATITTINNSIMTRAKKNCIVVSRVGQKKKSREKKGAEREGGVQRYGSWPPVWLYVEKRRKKKWQQKLSYEFIHFLPWSNPWAERVSRGLHPPQTPTTLRGNTW